MSDQNGGSALASSLDPPYWFVYLKMVGAMATALRGHAQPRFMPTQSGGHGTHHLRLDGLLPPLHS
jgi:hypothetical protein